VTATVAVPGALAVALAVGLGGELSPAAHVAVLTAGGAVLGAGLMRRAGAGSARVGRRSAPWLASSILVLAWEAVALADDDLPTISDLLDPVLAPAAVRAAATLAWLTVGAWLSARPGPTVGAAMRTTTGRALVLLAWLWVGLHFLAR
jgi:Family of unknown function (DUF6186)